MTACAECGFTYGELPRSDLGGEVTRHGAAIARALGGDRASLRARRSPEVWSPLEYACHVRDVLLMQRDRLYVALVEDGPSFKPMYREERVVFDRYDHQDPDDVAAQVPMAAALFANALGGLRDEQWARPLVYGYPAPETRDVEWVSHHTLHELVHHLGDMERTSSRT